VKAHSFTVALILLLVLITGSLGCGGRAGPAVRGQQGTGVFSEPRDGGRPPEGMVDLTIEASVKTPTPEHYLLESRPLPPGGGFPFELNVDGQEIVWNVEGARESTSMYVPSGRLPEGGEGIRYVLKKTIRLPAGPHHVFFGVPDDDYWTEVKVSLEEDMRHTLEFRPIYAMGRRGYRDFFHGISRTVVYLDGVRIK